MGNGEKALVYLGRYLYRGVIQERDILRCADGQVTFRYRDSESGKNTTRTVSGTHFLWLVLQHVLPKGFLRSRKLVRVNYPGRPATTILAGGGGVIFSSQRGFSVLSCLDPPFQWLFGKRSASGRRLQAGERW